MMIKKYTLAVLIGALAFTGYACDSNSSGNDDDEVETIVGNWVSEGSENVALGLQLISQTARIDAEFNSNGTYNVVSTDSAGSEVVFTGTYELGEEAESGIRSITLQQSEPASVVSAGIFRIDGNTMTYEVIQVEPSIDAQAPTVEDGFGSTMVGDEAQGTLWIQKYERQ